MGHNRSTDDAGRRAWRSFLLAHTRVLSRLDADLTDRCGMSLAEYEVLEHLHDAPGHQLRMHELAELARLSPSGLTRRFDALARRGWVVRERCADDRRGVWARLTDRGEAAVVEARPVHEHGERRYFADVLGDGEVDRVAAAMDRLVDANAPDEDLVGA